MKCERCGRHEAAVKYIEVEEGVKRSRWLCEDCAAEEGAQAPASDEVVSSHLQAFLGESETAGDEAPQTAQACPACGAELSQLHDVGRLGCPHCYQHFREELLPVLRRYHRATVHLGKAPRAHGPRAVLRREIGQLRSALETAVASENYEEAARLRDLIAARQNSLSATQGRPPGEDAAAGGEAPDAGAPGPGPEPGDETEGPER
jgi:protein arginine kinase activator